MKILILANNDVGLYKFRKELIKRFKEENNQIYVSLPKGELIPDIENLGVKWIPTPVDRRGINPFTDIKLLFNYIKLMIKLKPDLVISYTIKPNIYGGIASRILAKQYVLNITGLGTAFQTEGFVKKLVCMLYKFSSKNAKVVFFENDENKNIFIENKLIREEQAHKLCGAGVNLEEYPYTNYPEEEMPTRFLFIGRVMKEKGIDELFYAAQEIKKEYPEAIFDIVGPMEDEYGTVIENLQSENIIQYHGYQKDVKPFIVRSHCFVLPSWHEGTANTLLESAAMGRPLITSRISGCMEAVEDGETGYLFHVQNKNDLYEKLKLFMEMPFKEREAMGIRSREYVEKIFDKKKVVEETYKVIKNRWIQ